MRPGSQGMFAPRHSLAAFAIALAGLTAAGCRDINGPDPARAPHGALAAKSGLPKALPLRLDETFRAVAGAPLVACSPELSVPSRLAAEGVIAPHMGRTKSVLTVLSCEINNGKPIISVSDTVAGASGDSLSGYWLITISNIKSGKATLELEILFLSGSGWFDNTIGQATGSGVMDVASGSGSYSATGTISPREDGQAGGPLIAPQTITAGAEFACGLAASGTAYCWGRNQYGQLGDGTTTNRVVPTPVAGGIIFTQISAGGTHVCGLTPSRFTYCWGVNDHGQLGTGDVTTHPTPTLVSGGHLFAQISAGFAHTCAADTTGAGYCWGSNADATLGDGSRTDRHAPTAVKGGLSIKIVDAGGHHTCALTTTGSAYCWGANQYGQLGDGNTLSHTTPSAVVLEKTYAQISAGLDFTCGIEASSLLAFCWGRDNTYQLGDGNQTDRDFPGVAGGGGVHFSRISAGNDHACGVGTDGVAYCWGSAPGNGYSTAQSWPIPLPGSSAHNDRYKQVAAGTNFTCALSSAAVGYCWGLNAFGQLGSGSTNPNAGEPFQVSSDVPGGLRFAMISGGDINTCGMTSIGAVYCWGANLYGQVGDGTTTERDVPTPVDGGFQFNDLSVGGFHACAIRSEGGQAMCWGYNASGELGDGTTDVRTAPTPIAGSLAFAYIRAGGSHTCAIVSGGAVYCWGDNDAGQLGDGTTTDRHEPTLIAGPYAFGVIATGRWHTCALTRDGAAYCWGNYGTGQSNSPVLVPSPDPFLSLDAGDKNTCGMTRTNEVYCWGSNGSGQIGDGTTDPVEIPKRVMVLNGTPLAQFGVGDDHICVLTATAGAAFCAGMNLYGQLGDNTTTDRHEPTAVYNPGNLVFGRIDGGRDHTCALSNGGAYCWGSNAYGQLGNDDNDKVDQHAPAVVTRLFFKTQ